MRKVAFIWLIVILSVSVVSSFWVKPAQAQVPVRQYYAVVIGVADYLNPYMGDLDYPDDDAVAMYNTLLAWGWSPWNIQLLISENPAGQFTAGAPAWVWNPNGIIAPTEANINWALTIWLPGIADWDDKVLIYYAGHGHLYEDNIGLPVDFFPGDEADGYDEAIMPMDSPAYGGTAITDDKFRAWLSSIPGEIDVILDSCYSGGFAGSGSPLDPGGNPLAPEHVALCGVVDDVPEDIAIDPLVWDRTVVLASVLSAELAGEDALANLITNTFPAAGVLHSWLAWPYAGHGYFTDLLLAGLNRIAFDFIVEADDPFILVGNGDGAVSIEEAFWYIEAMYRWWGLGWAPPVFLVPPGVFISDAIHGWYPPPPPHLDVQHPEMWDGNDVEAEEKFLYPPRTYRPAVAEQYGPRVDNLLMEFYYTPNDVFTALDFQDIDIIDWPLTEEWADYFATVPYVGLEPYPTLCGLYAYKAYLNSWIGVVNQYGIGVNSWGTFLSAHTEAEPYSGTIEYGVVWTPSVTYDIWLNPIYSSNFISWQILDKIYDTLLKYDANNPYQILPWIAESWVSVTEYDPIQGMEVSVLYLDLRKDVYFHDGIQLTADDIIFTLTGLWNVDGSGLLQTSGYPNPSWVSNIVYIDHIDMIDDFNIKVYFLDVFDQAEVLNSVGSVPILPEYIWTPIVETGDPEAFAPDPQLIGSGPYRVYPYTAWDVYIPGVYMVLYAYKLGSVPGNPYGYFQYSPIQNFIVEGQIATPQPNTNTYWVGASHVASVKIAVKIHNYANYPLAVTSTLNPPSSSLNIVVPANSWVGLKFPYPITGGIGTVIGPLVFNEQTTWTMPPPPGIDTWTEVIYFKVTCDGDVISTGDPAPGSPGHVNIFDAVAVISNWGPTGPYSYPPADINWDSTVNLFDALTIMSNFGKPGA